MELTSSAYDSGTDSTTFNYKTCCYANPETSHWTVQFAGYGSGVIDVTKAVNGNCPEGTTFTVKVQPQGNTDPSKVKTLTFGCNGGTQRLEGLPFGTYEISEVPPSGWQPAQINPTTVTLTGCIPTVLAASVDGVSYPACEGGIDYNCYLVSLDPTTGVMGIKFDESVLNGKCRTFSFTLAGRWDVGTITRAIKAGNNVVCIDDVDGPVCPAGYEAVTVTNTNCVPPTFNCPSAPINLGCNPVTLPNCDMAKLAAPVTPSTITPTCEAGSIVEDGCMRTQSFTLTATDGCGNTATCVVTYTWKVDTTAPELGNLPVGGDLGCNPTLPSCVNDLVATDNCDGDVAVTCTPGVITGPDCAKSQTFTYEAVDACGNKASATVTYTWKIDTTAPVLPELPAGGDLGCNPTLPSCTEGLKAADDCDGDVAVTCTPGEITGPDCAKSQTFTYEAVDACGNKASATVTYTWKIDTTAPVLPELPAGGDLGCNPTEPTCTEGLMATDNCDGQVPVTCTAGDIENVGTFGRSQTFTYSAEDDCGKEVSSDVIYTWWVSPPCDITVSASDVCQYSTGNEASVVPVTGATYFWEIANGVIASGQGTPKITWTAGEPGETVITVTVTSPASEGGCYSTCDKTVAVEDCKECETAWMYWAPPGKCITSLKESQNWGWYVVTSANALKGGLTSPVIAGAGGCDPSKGYDLGDATVKLSSDGKTLTVDLSSIIPDDCEMTDFHVWASNSPIPASGGFSKWYKTETVTFKKALSGTIYIAVHAGVCCSACSNADACTYSSGNIGASVATVSVGAYDLAAVADEPEAEEPIETVLTMTAPQDIADVCADEGQTYATIADIGVPDASDPDAAITSDAPADGRYPIGTTTVTWTATDATGATASGQQSISVQDCQAAEEPMELTITSPEAVEACAEAGKDYAMIQDIGAPAASDPVALITSDAPNNGKYPIGETTVTWTATDAAGSTATCQQSITVQDCEAPKMICTSAIEVCPDEGQDYATIADIKAPVVNDPAAQIANDAPADGQYPIGATTVTWTAVDGTGNEAICEQPVTVKDPAACKPQDKSQAAQGASSGSHADRSKGGFNELEL